jgi:hypothetical protein
MCGGKLLLTELQTQTWLKKEDFKAETGLQLFQNELCIPVDGNYVTTNGNRILICYHVKGSQLLQV